MISRLVENLIRVEDFTGEELNLLDKRVFEVTEKILKYKREGYWSMNTKTLPEFYQLLSVLNYDILIADIFWQTLEKSLEDGVPSKLIRYMKNVDINFFKHDSFFHLLDTLHKGCLDYSLALDHFIRYLFADHRHYRLRFSKLKKAIDKDPARFTEMMQNHVIPLMDSTWDYLQTSDRIQYLMYLFIQIALKIRENPERFIYNKKNIWQKMKDYIQDERVHPMYVNMRFDDRYHSNRYMHRSVYRYYLKRFQRFVKRINPFRKRKIHDSIMRKYKRKKA